MTIPTQSIDLDVGREGVGPEVWLGEGDSNGTVLRVRVTEGGKDFDIEGYEPFLMVLLPDGRTIYRQGGTVEGGEAVIAIDESRMGNAVGTTRTAYLSLERDGVATSTQRFPLRILRAADGAADPEPYASDLDELYARAEELIGDLEGAGGIRDYEALLNKPQVNDVELVGNRSLEEIGVDSLTNADILEIFNRG